MAAPRTRLGMAIALAMLPAMAVAQHVDHSKMHHPAPAKKPVVKKKASAKPAAKPVAADPHAAHGATAAPSKPQAQVDHAAMGHAAPRQEPVDHSKMDHSGRGHDTPEPQPETPVDHSTMDHAAMGHDADAPMPDEPVDHSTMDHAAMGHEPSSKTGEPVDHSTMDHAAMGHDMPAAPTDPLTPIPGITDADRAAAAPPTHPHTVHDNRIHYYVLFNRLEAWDADPGTGLQWEAQSWIGTDLDRLWLRSEGERVDGHTESADLEVLYGRSVTPWWDVLAGVRHDFKPGRSQDFLALGVMGLAPYMFEVQATAYLGPSGRSEARVEVEYEMLLTNRLVLQPLVEVGFAGYNDAQRGVGSGLGTAETGLRLRYEIRREFAPYIGVVRERAFGRTADFRREHGEPIDDTRFVAGVRVWF